MVFCTNMHLHCRGTRTSFGADACGSVQQGRAPNRGNMQQQYQQYTGQCSWSCIPTAHQHSPSVIIVRHQPVEVPGQGQTGGGTTEVQGEPGGSDRKSWKKVEEACACVLLCVGAVVGCVTQRSGCGCGLMILHPCRAVHRVWGLAVSENSHGAGSVGID